MAQPAVSSWDDRDAIKMNACHVFEDGLRLEVLQDAEEVACRAADWLADRLIGLIEANGFAVLAISGGRSPWPMFRRLVLNEAIAWKDIHIVQVDERVAPAGDADRNWTIASGVFGSVVPQHNLHPMPVEDESLDLAAGLYADLLSGLTEGNGIGIVHLGLGADGHTASLFPGDDVLHVQDRAVAVTNQPHMGRRRMTLTLPTINCAQHVLWQVVGSDKSLMLKKLVHQDQSIPAAVVRRGSALILADVSAASELEIG
jgi:6-phosphogluconolactonase